jgi:hypothetical protein
MLTILKVEDSRMGAVGMWGELAVAEVSDYFNDGQKHGETAGGEAAHGDHEREPSGVGVWALGAAAAEDGLHEQDGEETGAEDADARDEELAGVGL